jgi:tetratricopeptide (TPR) repeat protein
MTSLFFWQKWNRSHRFLYLTSLGLLKFGLITLLFFHYRGLENTVEWQILSELDEVPVQLDSLAVHSPQSIVDSSQLAVGSTQSAVGGVPLDSNGRSAIVNPQSPIANRQSTIPLLGKAYLLKEQFVPVQIDVPSWLAWGYLGFLLAGLVLLLSAVSALSRWWYIAAMAIFIAFLASSHLEILQLFGSDKALGFGITTILLGGVSYYLHAFREDISIEKRIFIFAGLITILAVFVSFFTKTPLVALTVTSYSLLPVIALSVVFVGWLSVEIIAGFVYVVTNPRTGFGKTSLINFLFLAGLYLFSMLLLYLKITRQTENNFWYISPFILYVVSVILGVWSFEKRTEGLLPFREIGAWLYAGFGLVTTAAMAFVLFTQNNSLIEVFEDAIVYSQLAIGTIFTGYVALNFWPIFKQGKAVYKVIYKPMRILQSQAWLIGGMGVVALLALNRFFTVDQALAGHYNTLGDLHRTTKEYVVAEQYYQIALNLDYQNHKSGFALASLALSQGDRIAAGAFFQQALHKDPSPQAYAGLSQALLNENLFFDAIFNLRKGIQTFPRNGELQNNLGYLYTRTTIADSAYYYFEAARQNIQNSEVPETNLLSFWGKALTFTDAKNPMSSLGLTSADFKETQLLETKSNTLSHEANRLAVAQLTGAKTEAIQVNTNLPKDSALSVNNFAYLYNYGQYTRDSSLAVLFHKLVNTGTNGNFYHELQLAEAYSEYNRDKIAAFDILASQTVADTSQKVALARQTLQYWLLKEAPSGQAVGQYAIGSLKTEADFMNELRQHPLDLSLLQQTVSFFNQQKKPQVAYQSLLNALRFRRDSPELQKLYILQCLHLRLTDFAEDGLRDLFSITTDADYQAFLKTYQAQRALIEKERESFR